MADKKSMVVVGFKHSQSLILDLDTNEKQGGENGSLIHMPSDERYTINGTNVSRNFGTTVLPDTADRPGVEYGYAITENIPEDFWREWVKRNPRSVFLTKGLLFAGKDLNDAKAQARDKADLKESYPPIDPEKPGPGIEKVPNPDGGV